MTAAEHLAFPLVVHVIVLGHAVRQGPGGVDDGEHVALVARLEGAALDRSPQESKDAVHEFIRRLSGLISAVLAAAVVRSSARSPGWSRV